MAGSLLARTMASLRMYLACGLLLYVLLCSSSSMHIRRTDKGLALTSSLLPNFTHKFAIRIEAYLLALSHPSHFRHMITTFASSMTARGRKSEIVGYLHITFIPL